MNIPKHLHIRNFLSIEDFSYEFKEGETVAIKGKNLTDPGKKSNGSGKSSIQQAIEFLHKGSCSRKVTNKGLVMRGKRQAEIGISYYNTKTKQTLFIDRVIPLKDSTTLEVRVAGEGGEMPIPFDKVDSGNQWLVDYFGIDKEDMSSFYFPNEVSFIPFFLSSNTKKVAFVNRFSGANLVDSSKAKIEKDIDRLVVEKGVIEKELAKEIAKAELLQENIDSIDKESFEVDKKVRLSKIETEIFEKSEKAKELTVVLGNIAKTANRSRVSVHPVMANYLKVQKSLNEIEAEISKPKPKAVIESEISIVSAEEIKKAIIEEKKLLKESLSNVDKQLSNIEKELLGVIKCPKCSFEFFYGEEKDPEEVRKEKAKVEEKVKDFEEKVQAKEKSIAECDELVGLCNVVVEGYSKTLKGLSERYHSAVRESTNLYSQVKKGWQEAYTYIATGRAQKRALKEVEDEIKALENRKEIVNKEAFDDKAVHKFMTQLKIVNENVSEIETRVVKKDAEIAGVTQWLTIMKKFNQELANEKLRVIQNLANHHLQEMGVEVQLKIEGYKMLASGEVREEITGYVIDKGEIVEYSSQSKGERIRIDYAVILAIRSLLNASSDSGGIDLLFSDEISEGLDDLGTESLLDALSKTGNTILYTTHVLPDDIFPNMLFVKKINGISQITEN